MEDFNEQIDDYVRGKLQGKTRQAFEDQLKQDAKLAEQVEEQKILIDGITAFGQNELKAHLKTIHEDLFQQKQPAKAKVRRLNWRPLAAAASVALVAAVAYWAFFAQPNYEQLYATNFEPYAVNFNNRATDSTEETLQIQTFYSQQNYTAALPGLERLAQAEPQRTRVQLALAITYLAEGQAEQALGALNLVEDPLLEDVVAWYQALAHIRLGEKAAAKEVLQQLASTTGNYQAKASILLEEL
ncbi:MAG: tetratricopeptide repeat protein [Bacteroidota bacterium]